MAGKPGLVIALGGPKPPPEHEPDGDEGMGPDATKAAMRDMFAAAKSGDWNGAYMAFKDAMDACMAHHEHEEGESEE